MSVYNSIAFCINELQYLNSNGKNTPRNIGIHAYILHIYMYDRVYFQQMPKQLSNSEIKQTTLNRRNFATKNLKSKQQQKYAQYKCNNSKHVL